MDVRLKTKISEKKDLKKSKGTGIDVASGDEKMDALAKFPELADGGEPTLFEKKCGEIKAREMDISDPETTALPFGKLTPEKTVTPIHQKSLKKPKKL